jgi:hypothetical protein
MEGVHAQVPLYPKGDEGRAGQAKSQSEQVDGRMHLVFEQVADGNFEIILKHLL